MVVLDEDFGTGLTLVEGNGGVRLSPVSVPEHAPRDWRSQCERERARADAAEARAEELRWAEVAARSDGGSWKSRFKACRRRLSEAVEETKEARRTARDVPSLQAEVARLETLLSEAGIASAFDTAGALRKENARLRKALVDPSRKSGGALHRLHCFCLEFDGACEVQRRVPTDWIIEPVDVSGYGSFSLAS